MKCRSCGKTAKKYTIDRGGAAVSVELCAECYKRLYGGESGAPSSGESKECSACGTTFEVFRRTGLLGCAECYNVFRKEILSMLGYIQHSTRHVGKVPAGAGENYDDLRGLIAQEDILTGELQEAERACDGERAAELRSRLKAIAQKLRRTDS